MQEHSALACKITFYKVMISWISAAMQVFCMGSRNKAVRDGGRLDQQITSKASGLLLYSLKQTPQQSEDRAEVELYFHKIQSYIKQTLEILPCSLAMAESDLALAHTSFFA